MRRVATALATAGLVLGAGVPAAANGTDRTEPIPSTTGPAVPGTWYVNPAVPGTVDQARWIALVQRSVQRWGATFAGTTDASPMAADGLNVIGFSSGLESGVLGTTTTHDVVEQSEQPAQQACTTTITSTVTDDELVVTRRKVRVRLRRDRIRRGAVVRRSVSRKVRRTSYARKATPVTTETCTVTQNRASGRVVRRETDIYVRDDANWFAGPGHPGQSQMDLEQNLMHELGHAAGLSHQRPPCDGRTPMRATIASGEWWHAPDDAFRNDCSTWAITADPALGRAPGAMPPGSSLEGASIFVNPAVPAGYDPDRFIAMARSVIERLGGRYAGTTDRSPAIPDTLSVIGFGQLQPTSGFAWPNAALVRRHTVPSHDTCTPAKASVRERVVRRRTVRWTAGARRLKLRRDRLVTAERRKRGYACGNVPATVTTSDAGRERDVILNDAWAWELGPEHPVLATRMDAESAILKGLIGGSGVVPSNDACDTTSPMAVLVPGDWWRGGGDVSRAECNRDDQTSAETTTVRRGDRTVVTRTIEG
jgi:hypothetical protein